MRPKKLWVGNHYGTALDGGLVAHTTPEKGKHVSTLEEFAEGRPISIRRRRRTAIENLLIQQRAIADIGKPYLPAAANCEHDVTMIHDGRPYSPMLQSFVVGLAIGATLFCLKNSKN
jgi:hypothetical protein